MSQSPPWNREAEVSVTFKHDGKYEAPWLVFRGSPEQVRADIMEAIGFDPANHENKSLWDIALEADKMAKAQFAASDIAGGKVISKSRKASTKSVSGVSESTETAEQPAADASPEENPLLKKIAAQTNVADLKRLWAENQEAFKDGDLMDAYKARGKELKQ